MTDLDLFSVQRQYNNNNYNNNNDNNNNNNNNDKNNNNGKQEVLGSCPKGDSLISWGEESS